MRVRLTLSTRMGFAPDPDRSCVMEVEDFDQGLREARSLLAECHEAWFCHVVNVDSEEAHNVVTQQETVGVSMQDQL